MPFYLFNKYKTFKGLYYLEKYTCKYFETIIAVNSSNMVRQNSYIEKNGKLFTGICQKIPNIYQYAAR